MSTFNLTKSVFVSTSDDTDGKFRVANDTARDALITGELIKIGNIIYHEADQKHYSLKTYPTIGSITGVVWEVFGNGNTHFKLSHETESALNTAHPTGVAGDYAIVNATDTIWVWDTDTNAWVNSGSGSAITVLDILTSSSVTAALSANQGRVLRELIRDNVVHSGDFANNQLTLRDESGNALVNIGVTLEPNTKSSSIFSVTGILTINVNTYDFDLGTELQTGVTGLKLTNGSPGKTYTAKIKQDGTGGRSFVFAVSVATDTAYLTGDWKLFPDKVIYEATSDHTTDLSDVWVDVNAGRWVPKVAFVDDIVPIISQSANKVDNLVVQVQQTGQYLIYCINDVKF